MFSQSSWLHLRIHFSFFLLPIFLFSLSLSPNLSGERILWVFIILHLILYPASNGYNSYFDKDEKSIEGKIVSRIKGGMMVDIGVKAFLPGSQIDLHPVRDLDGLEVPAIVWSIRMFRVRRRSKEDAIAASISRSVVRRRTCIWLCS